MTSVEFDLLNNKNRYTNKRSLFICIQYGLSFAVLQSSTLIVMIMTYNFLVAFVVVVVAVFQVSDHIDQQQYHLNASLVRNVDHINAEVVLMDR